MATISLMIATFLNPFGFDILVYKLTQLTNDYWNTMYVLYLLAFLLLLLSYLFFKLKKIVIGNLLVTTGLFLNPLGYDLVLYSIDSITNSYWLTISIMYGLSFSFFGLFIYLNDYKIFDKLKNKILK